MQRLSDGTSEALEVDRIAIAIPARRFKIKATLAYDQSVPLVDEFILRFLRLCGDVSTNTLREFFGFSNRELFVTLLDLSERGLIETKNGSVQLGARGRAAFKDTGDDEPRIVAVQETDINVAFEQIASTPIERTPYRQASPTGVMELRSENRDRAARPSEEAIQSFKVHFAEIAEAYLPQRQDLKRAYVYSVDEVTPKRSFRHELVLPILLEANGKVEASVDYSKLLNSRPRGSRDRLVAQVSELLQTQQAPKSTPRQGFDFMSEFDTGLMSGIFSGNQPSKDNILQWLSRAENAGRAEPRSEVLEFVGSPSSTRVSAQITTMTAFGEGDVSQANKWIFWLKPNIPIWGRSSAFRETLDRFARTWGEDGTRVLLVPGEDPTPPRDQQRAFRGNKEMPSAFDLAIRLSRDTFPDVVELIYRPDCWVAVAVYMSISENAPRVPFGFVSANPQTIKAAGEAIRRRLLPFSGQSQYIWPLGQLTNDQMTELVSQMLS
jgi:hypothetical protein